MARIDWVKYRLDNWALWKSRERGGGLGFASQAAFLNEATTDRYRESVIPIDEVDASVTDEAVEALKLPRPKLYEVLQLYYVEALGIQGTMSAMLIPRATVYACLDVSDRTIAAWFRDRMERQRLAKSSFTP
ncbi:MAG: hypothetical protein JWP29_2324 [Rhodoferax sp.]|nr:hypothetical protein [Rhodoferax sp.]